MIHTPKLLFVDDRWKRMKYALEKYDQHFGQGEFEVTLAANVKETLRALARENFDFVGLDHDLRGCDFEDPDSPESGMEIIRYIERFGWPNGKPKPIFIVHSSNVFAAHQMVMRLDKLGFQVKYSPIRYDEEIVHMKYNEKGNPV